MTYQNYCIISYIESCNDTECDSPNTTSQSHLVFLDIDTLTIHNELSVQSPLNYQISPNGKVLAITEMQIGNTETHVIDLADNLNLRTSIVDTITSYWSPNSRYLLLKRPSSSVSNYTIYSLQSDTLNDIKVEENLNISHVLWSLDSNKLAFTASYYPRSQDIFASRLHIFDLLEQEYVWLSEQGEDVDDFIWVSANDFLISTCRSGGNCNLELVKDGIRSRIATGNYSLVALSPDGESVLLHIDQQSIGVFDIKTRTITEIAIGDHLPLVTADGIIGVWSASGEYTALLLTNPFSSRESVWLHNKNTGILELVGEYVATSIEQLLWHPTENYLLVYKNLPEQETLDIYEVTHEQIQQRLEISLKSDASNLRWTC